MFSKGAVTGHRLGQMSPTGVPLGHSSGPRMSSCRNNVGVTVGSLTDRVPIANGVLCVRPHVHNASSRPAMQELVVHPGASTKVAPESVDLNIFRDVGRKTVAPSFAT